MKRSAALALVLAAAAFGAEARGAAAADYPYSGIFTVIPPDTDLDKGLLTCAFSFFRQNADGSYTSYHLDLDRYRKSMKISFVEYSRGACTLDESGKVETCKATMDADPAELGKPYIDVFEPLSTSLVRVRFFDELASAQAFAETGEGAPVDDVRYSLCPDAMALGKYVSTEQSTLSSEARLPIIAPDLDEQTTAIMRQVLNTIRKENP